MESFGVVMWLCEVVYYELITFLCMSLSCRMKITISRKRYPMLLPDILHLPVIRKHPVSVLYVYRRVVFGDLEITWTLLPEVRSCHDTRSLRQSCMYVSIDSLTQIRSAPLFSYSSCKLYCM